MPRLTRDEQIGLLSILNDVRESALESGNEKRVALVDKIVGNLILSDPLSITLDDVCDNGILISASTKSVEHLYRNGIQVSVSQGNHTFPIRTAGGQIHHVQRPYTAEAVLTLTYQDEEDGEMKFILRRVILEL